MMDNNHLPIGVFDSGMGGLTVLRALKCQLPHESYIYLGDTARLPYGTKSPDTVKQYAIQMAKVLIERRIKVLVVACNTATTAALPHLQQMLPDIPVLGVVEPGAQAVVHVTLNQRIMVFATETTIASQIYQRIIRAQLPQADIQTRACSLLVALAEEGMQDNPIAEATLTHYLSGFDTQDTLLLGCTHFPVFKKTLQKLLPSGVHIVDSAQATANALQQLLDERQLQTPRHEKPFTHFLVTDSVERFQTISPLFLGDTLQVESIENIDGFLK